jgi:hypothetical protein
MHPSGDGGRNESDFLVSYAIFFFPWRSEPRLARPPQHFNRRGPFRTPTCTCDQSALPDSEAIKSKREGGAVRTTVPFISAVRPLAFHFSRAECQARLLAPAVAGGKFENNQDAPVPVTSTVHLAPFFIKNPNLACNGSYRRCSLSPSSFTINTNEAS